MGFNFRGAGGGSVGVSFSSNLTFFEFDVADPRPKEDLSSLTDRLRLRGASSGKISFNYIENSFEAWIFFGVGIYLVIGGEYSEVAAEARELSRSSRNR